MNIQAEEFIFLATKDDKIKSYLNLLKLHYNHIDIMLKICELEKDFYDNFPCPEKHKKGSDVSISEAIIFEIELKLIKNCIENPIVKNLIAFMDNSNFIELKIKDFKTSWSSFEDICKMLRNGTKKQCRSVFNYAIFEKKLNDLEENVFKFKNELDELVYDGSFITDLSLKSCIFYFLANNEDVLIYTRVEKVEKSN
jgi:hypothetical protein